ncbi:hypothetical protein E0F76_17880 [Flavobacterium cellulosilyticum]|uniref:Uncharacterized protein n=2 Tax=Flavobacterium cellulosilyticum TaxID=2541731 RepID=A0A4R5CAD9_9FLAO|nr:hypothetical protein E0F76_17880 [Flavobacterium cellulosilyticum]
MSNWSSTIKETPSRVASISELAKASSTVIVFEVAEKSTFSLEVQPIKKLIENNAANKKKLFS